MGATPAHATLDMLAVASMDVWVSELAGVVIHVIQLKEMLVLCTCLSFQILMSVPVTMEDVNKTVTTALGATPAHATLDMLAVASMDVWVCSASSGISGA